MYDVGTVSSIIADWSREKERNFWDPGRNLLRSVRDYQKLAQRTDKRIIARRLAVLRYKFWATVTQCEIHLSCSIGGGLLLPHPNGIVIHPKAIIGVNCLIFQQVTIGTGGPVSGVPQIGGHVDIGAGAKILGGVRIGNHAKIGANAVVLGDVPEEATAVGVPARIV